MMEQVQQIIEKIARRYAARCWWASLDDLRQQGWLVALTALKNRDPKRPLGPYLSYVVTAELSELLWRQSTPVKAGYRTLKGLQIERKPVDMNAPADKALPDEALHDEHWRALVRRKLKEHLDPVSARVLLEDCSAREVAHDWAFSAEEVSKVVGKARGRIKRDRTLRRLALER